MFETLGFNRKRPLKIIYDRAFRYTLFVGVFVSSGACEYTFCHIFRSLFDNFPSSYAFCSPSITFTEGAATFLLTFAFGCFFAETVLVTLFIFF